MGGFLQRTNKRTYWLVSMTTSWRTPVWMQVKRGHPMRKHCSWSQNHNRRHLHRQYHPHLDSPPKTLKEKRHLLATFLPFYKSITTIPYRVELPYPKLDNRLAWNLFWETPQSAITCLERPHSVLSGKIEHTSNVRQPLLWDHFLIAFGWHACTIIVAFIFR